MTQSAEAILHQCFDTLTHQVPGLDTTSETLGERFELLSEAALDPVMHERISIRLLLDGRFYRAIFLKQDAENFQGRWREYAILYLFTLLAKGSINNSSSYVSLQHWIPVCYTRNFAERVSSKRVCHITRQQLEDGEVVQELVTDKEFVHRPGHNGGNRFYDGRVEFFLSQLESMYATSTRNIKIKRSGSPLQLIIVYLFMEVLELRKPDPKGKFSFRTYNELIRAVCARLDELKEPHLTFAFPESPIGFTPRHRSRIFKTLEGTTTRLHPINPAVTFIVSNAPLSDSEADRLATRHGTVTQERIVKGEAVYGVKHDISE